MPDNRGDTKPDFDFSADARLPRHVIVLLAIFLLLLGVNALLTDIRSELVRRFANLEEGSVLWGKP